MIVLVEWRVVVAESRRRVSKILRGVCEKGRCVLGDDFLGGRVEVNWKEWQTRSLTEKQNGGQPQRWVALILFKRGKSTSLELDI